MFVTGPGYTVKVHNKLVIHRKDTEKTQKILEVSTTAKTDGYGNLTDHTNFNQRSINNNSFVINILLCALVCIQYIHHQFIYHRHSYYFINIIKRRKS